MQIKNSVESFADKMEQAKTRVSGSKDTVQELGQSDKDKEKLLKKMQMKYARPLGHHQKTKSVNHGTPDRQDQKRNTLRQSTKYTKQRNNIKIFKREATSHI
jgi:hypothetical protein